MNYQTPVLNPVIVFQNQPCALRTAAQDRAAKAGLAAPVNAAYLAAHQAVYAGKPSSVQKRVGSFMAVGLDLDDYSQKRSALCPYDDDIVVKNLKKWGVEGGSKGIPETTPCCARAGKRARQIFQG